MSEVCLCMWYICVCGVCVWCVIVCLVCGACVHAFLHVCGHVYVCMHMGACACGRQSDQESS